MEEVCELGPISCEREGGVPVEHLYSTLHETSDKKKKECRCSKKSAHVAVTVTIFTLLALAFTVGLIFHIRDSKRIDKLEADISEVQDKIKSFAAEVIDNSSNLIQNNSKRIDKLEADISEVQDKIKSFAAEVIDNSSNLIQNKITDCVDVLKLKPFATSGVYNVTIFESEQIIPVYCDMDTEGGGWTIFQRRLNGSVDFYRTFKEYETGFGDIHGEFWLGLKKVQEMLNQGTSEVRIDVVTSKDRAEHVKYSDFQLVNGDRYQLALNQTSLTGTVPDDSFGKHAGASFSTKDRDYDTISNKNCAQNYHGAWWYTNCSKINLNGFYEVPGTQSNRYYGNGGVIYREVDGFNSLKETKMMFRRI